MSTDKTTTTHRALAGAVRDHIEKLNAALAAAHDSGLSVHFGVSVFGDGRRAVSDVRIERPGSWREGRRSIEL